MLKKELETYCPKNTTDWRRWLEKNHQTKQSIWLIYHKVSTKIPSISWSEAVDEALCFGWIDSTKKSIDNEKYMQYFSKRKPKSNWSKVNKEKVDRLIRDGLMQRAGLASIAVAKNNGSWMFLDNVENLIVPHDLEIALKKYDGAKNYFESQSKSNKKILLYWIISAKREETRNKRVTEIALSASKGVRPKQFR